MLKKIALLVLLCAGSTLCQAQGPYAQVDSTMRAYTKKVSSQEDLWRLTYFIRKMFSEDSLRLRAAFVWITNNIDYDIKAFQSEDPRAAQLEYVLKKKKAICAGYATLLKYFCDAYNIENAIVEGRGRGLKSDVYIANTKFRENHAWNAVKINGQWRLIDQTWAAGGVSGFDDEDEKVKRKYIRAFDDFYYFSPPERFALNHYPKDVRYSYVTKLPDYSDFALYPLFTTQYLKGNGTGIFPSTSLLAATVGDTLKFRFQTKNIISRVSFFPKKVKAVYSTYAKNVNDWYEVKYPVDVSGYYDLNIAFDDDQFISVTYKLRVQPKY